MLQVCDCCGKEFIWQKGNAYCSYECQKKMRERAEAKAKKNDAFIESTTKCPVCGNIGVRIQRYCSDDHGFIVETYYKCKKCDRYKKDYDWYKEDKADENLLGRMTDLLEEFGFRSIELKISLLPDIDFNPGDNCINVKNKHKIEIIFQEKK